MLCRCVGQLLLTEVPIHYFSLVCCALMFVFVDNRAKFRFDSDFQVKRRA